MLLISCMKTKHRYSAQYSTALLELQKYFLSFMGKVSLLAWLVGNNIAK